jgi:AcrR family transcriptional regulator
MYRSIHISDRTGSGVRQRISVLSGIVTDLATPRPRGRPRQFVLSDALDRAVDVFWERGYEGSSLDDLTSAMGLARPSVYAAFGDKLSLFLAVLDRYAETIGSQPLKELLRADDPLEGVQAFLAGAVALAFTGRIPRGCLVACVAVDAAGCDPTIRERVHALIDIHDKAIAERFRAWQAEGRMSGTSDPHVIAQLLVSLMQGIAIRARAGAAREDLDGKIDAAARAIVGP